MSKQFGLLIFKNMISCFNLDAFSYLRIIFFFSLYSTQCFSSEHHTRGGPVQGEQNIYPFILSFHLYTALCYITNNNFSNTEEDEFRKSNIIQY